MAASQVIVRLSVAPERDIALSFHRLVSISEYFSRALSSPWYRPGVYVVKDDGSFALVPLQTPTFVLNMSTVSKIWTLQLLQDKPSIDEEADGSDTDDSRDATADDAADDSQNNPWHVPANSTVERIIPFDAELPEELECLPMFVHLVPRRSETVVATCKTVLDRAIDAHRLLFEALDNTTEIDRTDVMNKAMLIADCTTYAEHYSMLHKFQLLLREALQHVANGPEYKVFDKDVSYNANFYLGLSFHLHCGEVFEDAMRHVVGRTLWLSDLTAFQDDCYHTLDVKLLRSELSGQLLRRIDDAVARISLPTGSDWSSLLDPPEVTWKPLSNLRDQFLAVSTIISWFHEQISANRRKQAHVGQWWRMNTQEEISHYLCFGVGSVFSQLWLAGEKGNFDALGKDRAQKMASYLGCDEEQAEGALKTALGTVAEIIELSFGHVPAARSVICNEDHYLTNVVIHEGQMPWSGEQEDTDQVGKLDLTSTIGDEEDEAPKQSIIEDELDYEGRSCAKREADESNEPNKRKAVEVCDDEPEDEGNKRRKMDTDEDLDNTDEDLEDADEDLVNADEMDNGVPADGNGLSWNEVEPVVIPPGRQAWEGEPNPLDGLIDW